MKTLNLVQGSPEWHAHRDTHDNASEAPAMMNCSPYESRAELIKRRATGIKPEVSDAQQGRFNDGHRFEALCRPLAEEIIGQRLYPVTGSEDEGRLSASFDGLTMDESIGYEHKTLNAQLRQVMVDGATGADLPLMYRVQMEQQCMVSGAATILFMASKWQNDALVEKRHVWYETDPALAELIRASWAQLEKDVAAYVPARPAADATPTAKLREELPALIVNVTGEVTESNLADFKAEVMQRIEDIPSTLETDQQFVDGDADAKWLRDVAVLMRAAVTRVRSGITSVNTVLTTLEQLETLADAKAKALENKVKSEKQSRKDSIIIKARADFAAHVAGLNNELAPLRIALIQPDFDAAAKGLKTLVSVQAKVDAAMAAGKIAADGQAKDVRTKVAWLGTAAAGYETLFADLQQLVAKPMEDFQLAVTTRVDQQKAADAAKEEQRLVESIWHNARRIEGPQVAYIEKAISFFEVGARDFVNDARPAVTKAIADARAEMTGKLEAAKAAAAEDAQRQATATATTQVEADAPAVAAAPEPVAEQARPVVATFTRRAAPAAAPAPAPMTPATLRIGDINERLGVLSITAAGLRTLGFEPEPGKGAHGLYHERDWPLMLASMVQHLESLQAQAAA